MNFPVSVRMARGFAVAISMALLASAAPLIVTELGRAAPTDSHDLAESGPTDQRLDAKSDPTLALWLSGIDGRLPLGLGADEPLDRHSSGLSPPEARLAVSPRANNDWAASEPERPVRDIGPVRPGFGSPGRGPHGGARGHVGTSSPRRRTAPDATLAADDDSEPEESTRLVMDGRGISDTYVDRLDDPSDSGAGCDAWDCARRGRHHPQ